jgi:predicted RNase H-like HicB family nuclease
MTDPERYTVLLERAADGGWGAWSPDLPGCVALGDTAEGCIVEMREAIAFHLEGMTEDGEAIPQPTGPGVYVERTAAATAAA